jgi:hypothetical protein
MRVQLGAAAFVLAAISIGSALAASGGEGEKPLYGVAWDRSPALVKLDPDTLRPLAGRRVPIAGEPLAWSFAPGGRRMVLGSAARGASLRVVDLGAMRRLGDIGLARQGSEAFSTWAGPGRVLAALVTPGCCGAGDTTVVGVDVARRRVAWRRVLGGSLQAGEPFRGGMVLVLGPRGHTLGPSRLVEIRPDGRVRSAPLPAIRSGSMPRKALTEVWSPGLAVDARRGRAFVVQAAAPVAEVDLASFQVRSHAAEPSAGAADATAGRTRRALLLRSGLLAVTGSDCDDGRATPAGVTLIDTRTWRARTINRSATDAGLVAGTLLATSWPFDCGSASNTGTGLTAYSQDGRRRFHRFGHAPITGVQPIGTNALVGTRAGLALIDARTGRKLRTFRRAQVSLLDADAGFLN